MSDYPVISPKKLIEVALPLDAINAASVRENYIYRGNPSAVHKWWAQRPLATARAVIFAQLVNDPTSLWEAQNPGQKPSTQQRGGFTRRKQYLFKLITELVVWENNGNQELLERARREIAESWREVCSLNSKHPQATTLFNPDQMPALHDPFAGGGTIPLEAQRLGLEAIASDLNPVAVLMNKAMIEMAPKFSGRKPVCASAEPRADWRGAQGLAEDVRRYGAWVKGEADKRIGYLYPSVTVTEDLASGRPDLQALVGEDLTTIAWMWARTVRSPNPAFSHVAVPLVSSFVLGSKPGRESWVAPIISGDSYHFEVRRGPPPGGAEVGTRAGGRGGDFRCLLSGSPIDGDYIKAEGQAGRMGARLMAVVAEGLRGRLYVNATAAMEATADAVRPLWRPMGDVPARLTGGTCVPYGLRQWGDLFTQRQLVALTTLADLIGEARERVRIDAEAAGLSAEGLGFEAGGAGSLAYAEMVSVYLSFALSKTLEYSGPTPTHTRDPGQPSCAPAAQTAIAAGAGTPHCVPDPRGSPQLRGYAGIVMV